MLPLPVGEHITSCLVYLGREVDIAHDRPSFRHVLFTNEDGLFSSAVKHLLWHTRLVLQARLDLQALLTSSHGGHVLLGGIGFFLLSQIRLGYHGGQYFHAAPLFSPAGISTADQTRLSATDNDGLSRDHGNGSLNVEHI